MSDVDTAQERNEEKVDSSDQEIVHESAGEFMHDLLRRFVLFISFGPGVLGFLWLIGRILKR
ncbi:hypothetical protein GC174_16590 [bacterium]|nr:hypothetical protein [bacterium]